MISRFIRQRHGISHHDLYLKCVRNTSSRYFSLTQQLRASETDGTGTNDKLDKKTGVNWGETIILPKTKFNIKYSPAITEKLYQERCTTELYEWQKENNQGPLFILHDGPPYANGKLHLGHALNRITKDITNRYKVLRGYKVRYIPGWDCHGLPIEMKAISKNKVFKMNPLDIRKVARKCALEAIQDQTKDLKRWGIMADWNDVYRTLDSEYIVRQLKVFKEFLKKGYVYRQFRPVHWSPSSQTALAESELEYNETHTSTAAYVRFRVSSESSQLLPENLPLYAVIWTTTPWTIPSNQAIAVHPDIDYAIFKSSDHNCYFILASALQSQLSSVLGSLEFVKNIKGQNLKDMEYQHPLYDETMPFIYASYVTDSSGTGLVHTAPGHGMSDYIACQEVGISSKSYVDSMGLFNSEAGASLQGKEVLGEGTQTVLELLTDKAALLHSSPYVHSYPYDWRTKKPVIQRATSQWFINVSDLSKLASEMIKKDLKTIPESGLNRLTKFIQSRSEWCISRQRSWGVPIPVFYNEDTGEPLLEDKVIDHVIDQIQKHGADAWWSLPIEELLPPSYVNGDIKYIRGTDTMDVWFDSGTSWTLIDERFKHNTDGHISDVYLEGSDQHRGWFQSSLLTCVGVTGRLPYSTLITHGFLLDQNGQKMSKSIGNVIEPSLLVNGGKDLKKDPVYGADGLRFWVASSDYTQDVGVGPKVLAVTANCVSKVRNSTRFLLANLKDFDESQLVPYNQLLSVDKFVLHELSEFAKNVTAAYDTFTYNRVAQELFRFSSSTLSSFYFEITKDRLYLEPASSLTRRSAQTVMFHILNVYMRAIAPIACHMAEEIFDHAKFLFAAPPNSVFHLGWLNKDDVWNNQALASQWELVHQLRKAVNTLISQARDEKVMASSLEACVSFKGLPAPHSHQLTDLIYDLETSPHHELTQALIVSSLSLESDSTSEVPTSDQGSPSKVYSSQSEFIYTMPDGVAHRRPITVEVTRSRNHKCPRCWVWSASASEQLCHRCQRVVSQ